MYLPDICKDVLRPCPVKLCVRWVELAKADALGVARQWEDHILPVKNHFPNQIKFFKQEKSAKKTCGTAVKSASHKG